MTDPEIIVYCPECRGRFEICESDIVEGEVLECDLCGTEIEVVQESPVKMRLFSSEDNF